MLGVQRERTLQAEYGVGNAEGETGKDDERAGVPLPGLLLFRTGAEQPIDGPLNETEIVDPTFVDRHHVAAQVSPAERQGNDEDDDGPKEAHLKPLGLEHGHAEVDEDEPRNAEQDALNEAHTRSKAQIRPEKTAMKPATLSTLKKSAMTPTLMPEVSMQNQWMPIRINTMSTAREVPSTAQISRLSGAE